MGTLREVEKDVMVPFKWKATYQDGSFGYYDTEEDARNYNRERIVSVSYGPEEYVLNAPARVGNVEFHVGVPWSRVIERAQREYEYHRNPPLPEPDVGAFRQLMDSINKERT